MATQVKRERQPKNYKYTAEEKETIVNFSDASDTCTVYTCNKSLQLELTRKGYTQLAKDANSTTFECPKKLISFRTLKVTKVASGRAPRKNVKKQEKQML